MTPGNLLLAIDKDAISGRCPEIVPSELELKQERWVKNTLRHIYTDNQTIVVKCFFHYPGRRDYRRPWILEDKALKKLSGLNVPNSFGYFETKTGKGIPAVVYIKEFMNGVIPVPVNFRTAKKMGKLLSEFHKRGVVTLDPSLSNFIQLTDGSISFFDFGRARIYANKGLLHPIMVGKEFYRLFRSVFKEDHRLMTIFKEQYFDSMSDLHRSSIKIIDYSFSYWQKKHIRKHG